MRMRLNKQNLNNNDLISEEVLNGVHSKQHVSYNVFKKKGIFVICECFCLIIYIYAKWVSVAQ